MTLTFQVSAGGIGKNTRFLIHFPYLIVINNLGTLHHEETSKNSDNCDFSKVSDLGIVLYSIENLYFK